MQDDILYDITNNSIIDFDCVDEEDLDDYDDESDYSMGDEHSEADEYAASLNLPSTDFAVDLVGTNNALLSWVENKLNSYDAQSIAEYERITFEIEKTDHKFKFGLESIYRYYGIQDVSVTVANVEFCKRLFHQFCSVVFDLAYSLATMRDEKNLVAVDVVEALKSLGRTVYYNIEREVKDNTEDEEVTNEDTMNEDAMNDDAMTDVMTDVEDTVNNSFLDKNVVRVLVENVVQGQVTLAEDVYSIIHESYEDFLCTLLENALKLQREYKQGEEVSVEDFKLVLQMWKTSPCNTSNLLIQRLDVGCI